MCPALWTPAEFTATPHYRTCSMFALDAQTASPAVPAFFLGSGPLYTTAWLNRIFISVQTEFASVLRRRASSCQRCHLGNFLKLG